jgi:type I restriction enzyme S subunit
MSGYFKKWECLPLSEVFWFQEGPGVRKWQFTNSGIKLLNVANIEKEGTLNLAKTERYLSEEEVEKKYSHFLIDEGDLVIASSGISFDNDNLLRTRGAFVKKHDLPLCLNTSTIRFKAVEGISDLSFLRFWLNGYEFRSQITKLVTGTAQQNFGPSHLKAIKINLPPLEEQKKIAEILDQAEELRRKRREAIAQLDTLTQSIFLEMFGDPVVNPKGWYICELDKLISEFRYGSSNKSQIQGKPTLRIPNIIGGAIDLSDLKLVPVNPSEFKRLQLVDGDILFVRTNGNPDFVGRCAVFDSSVVATSGWEHLKFVRTDELADRGENQQK